MGELVSIIVPVYKTERYLCRCVNSIKRQDYRELEIILIDDGSPDNSGMLCEELAQTDNRIRVIHKENGGLSSARNAGIEAAKGDYLCFVDSDDYIRTDFVSTLIGVIRQYGADIARIDYIEVFTEDYTAKSVSVGAKLYSNQDVERAYLELRVDRVCVCMYSRVLIGKTRFPEGKTSEDIPFNFEIFRKAKRFVYLPEPKYFYWHNPESISNGPLNRNYLNYLAFRKEIYEFYLKGMNQEFIRLSEVLLARAAMGMTTRMAFYGIEDGMDERKYRKEFKTVFFEHSRAFFRDRGTAISRKMVAVLVFYFYPFARLVGRFLK